MKIGQHIKFRLDGKQYGEGTIYSASQSGQCDVKLTTTCKEFKIGDKIIISYDEIINESDTNKLVTEESLLNSMAAESRLDDVLQIDAIMPNDLLTKFQSLQSEWQTWMDARAAELNIPLDKLTDVRNY